MDDAGWQVFRPGGKDAVETLPDCILHAVADDVGLRSDGVKKRRPRCRAECIRPAQLHRRAVQMHGRQRPAQLGAFLAVWKAAPGPVKEGENRTGAALELLKDTAVARGNGQRAVEARLRKNLHDLDEKGEVGPVHTLFIQRQDIVRAVCAKKIVGILDALGNAGKAQHRAEVIGLEEAGKRVIIDIGIDRHQMVTPVLSGLAGA